MFDLENLDRDFDCIKCVNKNVNMTDTNENGEKVNVFL